MHLAIKRFIPAAVLAAFLLIVLGFGPTGAQTVKTGKKETEDTQKKDKKSTKEKEEQKIILHNEITVTATRTETSVFNVPNPVSVIGETKIQEKSPNNLSELLPELPGTDIVGVGANQSRPVIRGLRGQRILLLSDGIRLSNARRTQTFGEIPALTDISGTERVEVVRGPASVLYGSEAIGGVINIINRVPDYNRPGSHIAGRLGYRYSSADTQNKGFANIEGNVGRLGFMFNGSYRKAETYTAPAGTFGKIVLENETPILDSGVQDQNLNLFMGYRFSDQSELSMKYEHYDARDAGFGYVDPNLYSPGDPVIRLLYPDQKLNRFFLKYESRGLRSFFSDGLTAVAYFMKNKRSFDTNIDMQFSPGAGMRIRSSNFTDVETIGGRLELTKVIQSSHILTYGFDLYQDASQNRDVDSTEMFGFGPPSFSTDTTPKLPNAFFRSGGVFAQDQISLFSRAILILGLRYQSVLAKTRETEGISDPITDSHDNTFVGAANLLYSLTDNLKIVLSVGRGFRSSNLPERFFQGVTPDGRGYQIKNPDLKPETSLNFDVGFRYRGNRFYLETTYFRNQISDGIQIAPTGRFIGRLTEYRNVNIDRLKLHGIELMGQYAFRYGLTVSADFSSLSSKNLTNPELMNADTYSSRLNLNLRYDHPKQPFWMEYHIRLNGKRRDIELSDNPIGDVLPGFTVHSIRCGVTLLKNSRFPQRLGVSVGNLTNRLYSEFSNASFFRPAPKRHIVLTWSTQF